MGRVIRRTYYQNGSVDEVTRSKKGIGVERRWPTEQDAIDAIGMIHSERFLTRGEVETEIPSTPAGQAALEQALQERQEEIYEQLMTGEGPYTVKIMNAKGFLQRGYAAVSDEISFGHLNRDTIQLPDLDDLETLANRGSGVYHDTKRVLLNIGGDQEIRQLYASMMKLKRS